MIKIGIYKIENPDGLIYIGQSKDLDRRIRSYKNMKSRNQTKLKHSIDKYGWEFHKIEIIEFCNITELNNRERYWQDCYNSMINGLNCSLIASDDKKGVLSQETKDNLSISLKGRVFNQDWKDKLSKKAKERGVPLATRLKSIEKIKGVPLSKEHRDKISKSNKGKKRSQKSINKTSAKNRKKVVCNVSNRIWISAKECAIENKISVSHFCSMLNGGKKNKTSFKYLNE